MIMNLKYNLCKALKWYKINNKNLILNLWNFIIVNNLLSKQVALIVQTKEMKIHLIHRETILIFQKVVIMIVKNKVN